MTLVIEQRQPFGWLVLVALVTTLLVSTVAKFDVMSLPASAIFTGHSIVAPTAVTETEAQLIDGTGWSWKGVAIAAAVTTVVLGVTIATGGMAVLAYTVAAPAAATAAGVSWTAGAGLMIAGTTATAKGLSYLANNH